MIRSLLHPMRFGIVGILFFCAASCGNKAPGIPEGFDNGNQDTGTGDTGDESNDTGAPPEVQCAEAEARLSHSVCLHRIESDADWQSVTLPVDHVDQVRSTKYFVPYADDARLRPMFIDADYYTMHYDFIVEAFGELFEAFDTGMYLDLLFDPTLREYYVGEVIEFRRPSGTSLIGFYVVGDGVTPSLVQCEDLQTVYAELSKRMPGFELAIIPFDPLQRSFIDDCGLSVLDSDASLEYELYHYGEGYGTVRRHTPASLAAAESAGEIGWQDIIAVDEAPYDIETVVSGVVTGTRQSPLSHLGVRSASRGIPNCYLKDVNEYLAPYEGTLVKMTCDVDTLTVASASLEEAEVFWAGLRPTPVSIIEPDLAFTELVDLHAIPVQDAENRALSLSRFGGKARNLAWLYQTIDESLQFPGFGIPVAYYQDFVERNTWEVDVGAGPETLTFAETIAEFLADEKAPPRGMGARTGIRMPTVRP